MWVYKFLMAEILRFVEQGGFSLRVQFGPSQFNNANADPTMNYLKDIDLVVAESEGIFV